MTLHFKKAERPDAALRRVCRKYIGQARSRLRKSRHPAAVHSVRKEIKKLRAIFRLIRGEINPDDYRQAAKALRRAANWLAATRDARVRLQAFEQLAGPAAAERFPVLTKALQKDCRRESRRFRDDDSVELAGWQLRKTGRRLANLKFTTSGWAAIEPGLRQSYLRGRQTGSMAARKPSPENLHEWRKQVKTFWHQLQIVCPKWPDTARSLTRQLDELADLLGEEHDLFLLKRFVAIHSDKTEAARLNPLIEARQNKLRLAALKLGARVYAETPAAICRQLGQDWNQWQGQAGRH